jgi:hypothetical protein
VLHNQRKQERRLREREAAGGSFWTDEFSDQLRTKLHHLMRDQDSSGTTHDIARGLILRDEGWRDLGTGHRGSVADFETYVVDADDEMMPTVIEAWHAALKARAQAGEIQVWRLLETFSTSVNELLQLHRVSFELSAGEMIPFSSRELHVEVVIPTLALLASDDQWAATETAYRAALAELSGGDPADAVTDAGTALQEALTAAGAEGKNLGALIISASKKKILGGHDTPFLLSLEKAMSWVSADRSNTGDAHNSKPALQEDAWLAVHVVGALILRLSKGTPRNS